MKNIHLLLFMSLILLLCPINVFSYSRIWGSSGSDVFVVGGYGTIRHYDGSTWSDMSSGTTEVLGGVWGSSGSDVFAVGEQGTILHYNGSTWSAMPSGTTKGLSGVWGSSGSDVFAVGGYYDDGSYHGTILHYNGSTWSTMLSGMKYALRGVWGSSINNVFAVGTGGTILHYNGLTWSTMLSGTKYTLRGVWGISGSDVFAVGYGGTILHYNGLTWSSTRIESVTTDDLMLSAICGSSRSNVFAVGYTIIYFTRFGDIIYSNTNLHYNGVTWSANTSGFPPIGDTYALSDIWVSSSNDVFKVDSGGIIYHYSGPATTTTVPGGGLCPAQTVMGQNHLALNKIRTLRNEMFIKTGLGKYYTALYYKHAFELSQIFANDEELREKSYRLVQKVMPAIEELLAKREAEINEDSIREGIELIDVLITQAGAELGKDLNNLKKDIQKETILKTFKVKIGKN